MLRRDIHLSIFFLFNKVDSSLIRQAIIRNLRKTIAKPLNFSETFFFGLQLREVVQP